MKTIERENVRLDYTVTGKGETTLLFVHGAFINKEYWNAQVEYFSPAYKVVTIDLAGHGKSGKNRNDCSIQAMAEDVIVLIKELELSDIILIGHSFAGDVILEVAGKVPDLIIGFVGVDNFKNAGAEMPEEIQKQVDQVISSLKLDFSNGSEIYVRRALITSSTDNLISSRIIKDFRNFDPIAGVSIITSGFSYISRERELLKQLAFKLYLINVDYFPTNTDLLIKYAHSGFGISQIHGSCHYPMIEKPVEFNRLLQDIINKIEAGEQG